MKNKLKILLILVTVFVLLFIFFLSFLFQEKPSPSIKNIPVPSPIKHLSKEELFIIKILPENQKAVHNPAQPIEILFSQEVNKQSIKYNVAPITQTAVFSGKNSNSLIIVPVSTWAPGITKITFLGKTLSKKGDGLRNPQEFILNTAAPTIPLLEGAY